MSNLLWIIQLNSSEEHRVKEKEIEKEQENNRPKCSQVLRLVVRDMVLIRLAFQLLCMPESFYIKSFNKKNEQQEIKNLLKLAIV